jgi:hypothetical protein
MSIATNESQLEIGGVMFPVSRPHTFGLVIDRPSSVNGFEVPEDYLHSILLAPSHRELLFQLIEDEGLVVCRNVVTDAPSYRKVKGKSSTVKLSQAEYYHHDGCSSTTKPRVVEIRCPHQAIHRNIATAIAPFPAIIRAMLTAFADHMHDDDEIDNYLQAFAGRESEHPSVEEWDRIQGKVTRLVRKELDAEACRAYFRDVDRLCNAYALPWQMGESRLMLNAHDDLTRTMQHRRAYQKPREASEQNGSLVKRWTAEETSLTCPRGAADSCCDSADD